MVKVPNGICDDVFDKEFKRGSVIRTRIRFSSGTERHKFFIILNRNPQKDPTLIFLTTSKTDFFNKYPNYNKDIIRILPGELSYFTKETIIDCRVVYKISREDLKSNFRNNILGFIGELPSDKLQSIDRIVEQSFFISKEDKDIILGDST